MVVVVMVILLVAPTVELAGLAGPGAVVVVVVGPRGGLGAEMILEVLGKGAVCRGK